MQVTRGSGFLEVFLAKRRAKLANNLISNNHRNGRILDVGCGSYPYFLITTKFKEKYGIDPSVNLTLVKNKDIILKKNKIDKGALPFADNYFDTITMLAVFEHIDHDKLKTVLKEIRRVLKKDGIFIITTPAPWADKLLHFLATFSIISKEEIHEHKHNLSHKKIKDYLVETGFAKNKIRNGFFEGYMNMWFSTEK
jgi:ubiquinone/menaquinone biosynthesis C-methylase UbiE